MAQFPGPAASDTACQQARESAAAGDSASGPRVGFPGRDLLQRLVGIIPKFRIRVIRRQRQK
jgi:hypothetical protein